MLAARFALRELRGGLAGFRIFLACIALGTAAIGAVNTVADGIGKSIAAQGQSILAGDIGFELVQREATPDELAKDRGAWHGGQIAWVCARWRDCLTGLIKVWLS